MRCLVYNIRYATGHNNGYHLPLPYAGFFRQTHDKLDEIIHFIKYWSPDIIGLVEVDSGSYRSGKRCQAEKIGSLLGYSYLIETKYSQSSFAQRVPVLNKQSNALLSRIAAQRHSFHYFNEGVKRLVIEAEFDSVVVFIVHLSLKFRHRQNQLKYIYHLIKRISKPVILAGDFNTIFGYSELTPFLAATQLNNANLDASPSHPSHAPHRQIDFILHSREITVENFFIPKVQLSDHAPLICDFSFR